MTQINLLEINSIFKVLKESVEELDVRAYVIGGYVRDYFLQRPSSDIDIVCIGSGIQLSEVFASKVNSVRTAHYRHFGTAMVRCNFEGVEYQVEFVGARKESYNRNSRKPIVEIGTLEEDQSRRDFTINALTISLNADNFGELIDPFNGIHDLNEGIIRTPLDPDITYSDDPLRMMRAVRFATQLGFSIENSSMEAISRNVDRISIVSKERIVDELNKIILAPRPSTGFLMLDETGLLRYILPEMLKLKGIDNINGKAHKDVFYHTLKVLDNVAEKSDNLWLRWAAILHDIAKPDTKRFDDVNGWSFHGHEVVGARKVAQIFPRLKMPTNEKMKYVQKMVSLHLRPQVLSSEFVTDSAVRLLIFDAGEDIDDLMLLCNADITSANEQKIKMYKEHFNLVEQKIKELEKKDFVRTWQPPIKGEHIMRTFGLEPCKDVGVIKNAVKDAILDGQCDNSFEAAFQYMLDIAKTRGLEPVSFDVLNDYISNKETNNENLHTTDSLQ